MKKLSTIAPAGKRIELLALVLLLLVALALRVYRLGALAIWWDESLSVYRSTRDLATILSNTIVIQNVVTYDTIPPLYFFLLHFFVGAVGMTEFALRFFSVASNIATIPLVYALARRWFSGPIALVAAGLGALSPFYVAFSQEARPYALVLFLSTLAIYALTRAFQARIAPEPMWVWVYVAAAAATLYTHYYALFLLPVHWLVIFLLVGRRSLAYAWTLLPALPLAAALPLIPLIRASMAGNVGLGPVFVPLDMILRDVINSFSIGITLDFAQGVWIDLVLLGLFITGLVASYKTRAPIFLVALLLVPVLGVFVASSIRPLYQNSRYLISISPAFYLGVAAGVVALARRWRWVGLAGVGVFLLGATWSLNNLYYSPAYAKDDHRGWADYLRENWREGDTLILDSPHTEELFRYYAGNQIKPLTLPILRADRTESPAADLAAVQQSLARGGRVWFLEMHVVFDDPQQRIQKLLNENGVLLDQVDFPATSTELSLSLYRSALPVTSANAIPRPLDTAFTGNLRLRGYSSPPALAAGTRSIVRLFWQVDERVGEDYAVSLRLLDESENRVTQSDSIPLGNKMGTSRWEPQVILAEDHELTIPPNVPAGSYQLQVVPYHAATGNALGDPVTLGSVRVAPQADASGNPIGNKTP